MASLKINKKKHHFFSSYEAASVKEIIDQCYDVMVANNAAKNQEMVFSREDWLLMCLDRRPIELIIMAKDFFAKNSKRSSIEFPPTE